VSRIVSALALCLLVLAACGGGVRRRAPNVPLASYQGTWSIGLSKINSECDLATGQFTQLAVAFVQNGNQVLVRAGQNKGSVNGRKLVFTTTDVEGTKTIVTRVDVDMAQDGQSFFGSQLVTTTDTATNPASTCKENYNCNGQRVNPGATVEFTDYFPLHDGDSYEFMDGSRIDVMRDDSASPPSVLVTYTNPGGAPSTSWVMRTGTSPSFLDLFGFSRYDGASIDSEQYIDPSALPALVPMPLLTLLPETVVTGSPTITEGGRLEGTTGTGERYGGRSDLYVNYGRVPQVATPLGTFPDVVAMFVTETWDKKTLEPGPGRLDGDYVFNIWFARGFGPVGVQLPGQAPNPLKRATLQGVTID
jgi:hypothetical protein